MTTEKFTMECNCTWNHWGFEIKNGFIKKTHASSYFQGIPGIRRSLLRSVELTDRVIAALEDIKDRYDSRDVRMIQAVYYEIFNEKLELDTHL